jgi:hypothetical protein
MIAPSETPDYKYVAYIDESGDPGLKSVRPLDPMGSSEWITLAAVVAAAEREAEVGAWADELKAALRSRQMRDIHFQKLSPARKLIACNSVASRPVRCFVVSSNKRNMKLHKNLRAEKIPSDNWFYCWLSRLLLERVTHWVHQHSVRRFDTPQKVKLVFSERGGLSYDQMNAYYQWLRMKGDNQYLNLGNIAYECIDVRLLEVFNHVEHDGLKLPDIVASAFFKASDIYNTGACDPTYALALKPRMARSPDRQIAGYGLKLMPGFSQVRRRVLPEQLRVFEDYGYPKQWWADGGP